MTEDEKIRGCVLQLATTNFLPVVKMISETGITRSRALRFAWGELSSPYWCGPRQILFLHESGEVELWTPATLSA